MDWSIGDKVVTFRIRLRSVYTFREYSWVVESMKASRITESVPIILPVGTFEDGGGDFLISNLGCF